MPQKKWTIKRIFLIGVAFIITACLLFGGEALAKYFLKDSPLQQWAEAVPEIKEFTLQRKGEVLHLRLEKTEDLRSTLEPFLREIRERTKGDIREVVIETPQAPELAPVYYELSFILEEARVSGNYQALYEKLQELEAKYRGDFKVFIGEEFIFVQLAKNDLLYYQAVSRFSPLRIREGEVIR
ncbi:MAG: hypothetical protein GX085_01670 [Firmicutes bacterium]|nr:hypothetical protein [Bacillota bacterium]